MEQKPKAQVAQDDAQAWTARYGPGLRRYFQRRVAKEEAEDLVQEVFLALHARRGTAPVENVQGYLFAIAANLLARRRRDVPLADLDQVSALVDGFSPERLMISRQEIVLAIGAIRRLPPRAREAFILHRFEDMTYAAIGRRLGVSVSAVGKLIARALAQIARELGTNQ